MRKALCVAALLLAGCAHRVIVNNTPEGRTCLRDCMAIRNQCLALERGNQWAGMTCGNQERQCLYTCPGAHDE